MRTPDAEMGGKADPEHLLTLNVLANAQCTGHFGIGESPCRAHINLNTELDGLVTKTAIVRVFEGKKAVCRLDDALFSALNVDETKCKQVHQPHGCGAAAQVNQLVILSNFFFGTFSTASIDDSALTTRMEIERGKKRTRID